MLILDYHEMVQSPIVTAISTIGVILGVLFVIVFLTFGSALVAAVGLRKKLKTKFLNLKSQKTSRQYVEDHDYVIHAVEPHQHQEGHDENEGESLELKENEETQTDKDKDYYFMDTTLIGECINIIRVLIHDCLLFCFSW
jgi:DNA-dependent RNA polymerase auxiliary subunit epsilon